MRIAESWSSIEDMKTSIRTALEDRRRAAGMGYSAFARTLGISHETYRLFAVGQADLSLRTLQCVLTAYPELQEAARDLLAPASSSIQSE